MSKHPTSLFADNLFCYWLVSFMLNVLSPKANVPFQKHSNMCWKQKLPKQQFWWLQNVFVVDEKNKMHIITEAQ